MTEEVKDEQEYGGTGSITGYQVEGRYMFTEPAMICGNALDQRWRALNFSKVPPGAGVPTGAAYEDSKLVEAGCYSYQSAQALRWWFHAQAHASPGMGWCLETRLVSYKIRWEIKWKRHAEHAVIGGDDRSDAMPDWGKKT